MDAFLFQLAQYRNYAFGVSDEMNSVAPRSYCESCREPRR